MLSDVVADKLHQAVAVFLAALVRHPCLLVVHPEIGRLEQAVVLLGSTYGWPQLSVGRDLSAALLAEPPVRRPFVARDWLTVRLAQMAPGPVLCTEVDLLFESVTTPGKAGTVTV